MLRRRRSSLVPDNERVQSRRAKGEYTRIKFKESPCPEPEAPRRKKLDLTDIKVNLLYEEASTATESPKRLREGSISPQPINLRPSSILEIQRHLTPQIAKRQPRIEEPPNSAAAEIALEDPDEKRPPSVVIRSMWDNVVSWMKMAVDFIASDNPAEADPTNTTLSPCQKSSLKRPLSEEYSEGPSHKIAKLSFGEKTTEAQPKRRCGKKSKISFRPPRRSTFRSSDAAGLGQILALEQHLSTKQGSMLFNSPTAILAQNLSGRLAIQSPQGTRTSSGTSLFSSTKKFHSTDDGLNSILDETPNSTPRMMAGTKRIRRPVLREFYGSSVNSPNLDKGLRRSPRLAKRSTVPMRKENEVTEESVGTIPLPPPPPPIPTAPPTPHIPPPPPTPRLPDLPAVDGGESVGSERNEQRDLLQKMQHRLRTRMKKGGVPMVHAKANLTVKLDVKLKQWAEIQAHSRKITLEEFLSLAERKKMEIQTTLESLQSETPNSMEAVVHVVEILQEASQWFPGGSREMKDQIPLYKVLERKLEILNEYVQISSEMKGASISNGQQICHSGIHNLLARFREEFDVKHRHWGAIILTNAESWTKLGLPISCSLIEKSRHYLCSLVVRFVTLTLEEAANISGTLVSIKSVRASQAKEKLKDSLSLLLDAEPYFSTGGTCGSDPDILDSDASHQPLQNDYSQQLVLSLAIDVSLAHIRISMEQFEGDVCQGARQEVCEHFECVLKILNLLKTLASKVSDTETVRNSGVFNSLQKADLLSSAVYSSCVKLIQHIATRAQIHVSQEDSKEGSNREVVLWMMFGCKYVNSTLEVLGSEEADERGVQTLLLDLQQMETLLPDL